MPAPLEIIVIVLLTGEQEVVPQYQLSIAQEMLASWMEFVIQQMDLVPTLQLIAMLEMFVYCMDVTIPQDAPHLLMTVVMTILVQWIHALL